MSQIGRPSLPPGERRVQIAAKVSPATESQLRAEVQESGLSAGLVLDRWALGFAEVLARYVECRAEWEGRLGEGFSEAEFHTWFTQQVIGRRK